MAHLQRLSRTVQRAPFWRRGLAAKTAIVLMALVALRVALAQQPGGVVAPVSDDGQGHTILVPVETLSKGPKAKTLENTARGQIRGMLAGQAPLDRIKFDYYYLMYYFPMMTQTTDEALKGLPEERLRFFRDHLEYSG